MTARATKEAIEAMQATVIMVTVIVPAATR